MYRNSFHYISFTFSHFLTLMMCYILSHDRMTSNINGIHSFDCNFLRTLFARSPSHWDHDMVKYDINVFDRDTLLMPFDAGGHKSLFVVIGAKHIKSYSSNKFQGNRPCIVHLDPTDTPHERHNHHAVSEKIRVWLNRMWRHQHDCTDHHLNAVQSPNHASL